MVREPDAKGRGCGAILESFSVGQPTSAGRVAMSVLGLDIGGANLKAVHADGSARTVRFPLWKQPADLPAALSALLASMPHSTRLAVTMTGELCDCFATKREGVH